MDLDEQLAALAAGELDDDTARALRARAAAEPAIARRIARHEQLQRLLEGWEVPAMPEEAVARLDARIDEALAALGDGPLSEREVAELTPRPLAAGTEEHDPAVPGGTGTRARDAEVVDLGEARRRRGLPSWAPGVAVAAALVAVVGTGIMIGGLPGGSSLDTVAGEAEDATEDAPREEAADGADEAGVAADSASQFEAGGGPMRVADVEVAEGELLALVNTPATTAQSSNALTDGDTADDTGGGDDTAAAEDQAAEAAQAPEDLSVAPSDAPCVAEALERDTEQADGRDVWLIGTGTYAEEPAVFVVVRTPASPEDRFEVLAYEPDGCRLLARDETTG